MAVGAAHLALTYFAIKVGKASSTRTEPRYFELLAAPIDVIELEQNRIGFATVDARMCAEIVEHICAIANFVALSSLASSRVMNLGVLYVVVPAIER